MRAGISKQLVIDTDVAQASGSDTATHPLAKHCRDFLQKVLLISHSVVMTPKISNEWKKRQSPFARRWRVSMDARKKVCRVDPPEDEELREKIEKTATREKQIEVMRKDFHLLEAALATDQTIISGDKAIRRRFARATQHVNEIQNVVWVNPKHTEEDPLAWLKNGAPPEDCRQLHAWAHVHL